MLVLTGSVYVVVLMDRHTDPQLHVYTTEEAAVAKAKELAEDYDDAYEPDAIDGWAYHQQLSQEGDYVYVEERPIHERR